MSSGLSFYFLDEEIMDERCKGAYLKMHSLATLSLELPSSHHSLTEDNLPQCLMRVCEHCLYLPGRVPYFRRHYVILQGFLLHYGQCGGILWKYQRDWSTCERLSQMVKCSRPLRYNPE